MRPIDGEKFEQIVKAICEDYASRNIFDSCVAAEFILDRLKKTETIDSVPVVRCKDCTHYEYGVCLKIYSDGKISDESWQERKPDDYCSYGERK